MFRIKKLKCSELMRTFSANYQIFSLPSWGNECHEYKQKLNCNQLLSCLIDPNFLCDHLRTFHDGNRREYGSRISRGKQISWMHNLATDIYIYIYNLIFPFICFHLFVLFVPFQTYLAFRNCSNMAEDIDDLLDEVELKFCKSSSPSKAGKKNAEHIRYNNQKYTRTQRITDSTRILVPACNSVRYSLYIKRKRSKFQAKR